RRRLRSGIHDGSIALSFPAVAISVFGGDQSIRPGRGIKLGFRVALGYWIRACLGYDEETLPLSAR
ncbi:MAG TPA: hypothetical protein VFU97_15275, partial [Xanthobacteraceae bacterium]|nr:hypothetical protein [Xanthobacteraceae bacterium]